MIVAALSCITAASRANGRFPKAQVIATVPGSDGATVFLRTTFGILVSRAAGKSFRWVCERTLGYGGQWDPPIAVTRDGQLWVGLENGLVSTKDGCAVTAASELAGETIRDLTTDPRGETVWAISGSPGKPSHVWRKKESGAWERLGGKGLEDVNVMTIEVAPSKPSRLYVSGQPYDTIRGRLYRSDDGGQTFTGAANELKAEGPFFIAAVDPRDEGRVLARHLHTTGSDVLLTTDGGKTFRPTLTMASAMFGFAKSPDGKTLWAGSGLAEHGILRSTDRGEHWEKVASHGVLCLHAPAAPKDVLLACENPLALGASAVARSADRGATWTSLGTFGDVLGPVACGGAAASAAPDGGAALCGDAAWDEIRSFVMPRADADAGAGDAGAGPVDAGAEPSREAPPRPRACACDVVGGHASGVDPLLPIVGALTLALRARASRSRGSQSVQARRRARGSTASFR